jgi:hypothetical protein
MKHLEGYLAQKNLWRTMFKEQPLEYPRDREKIIDLLENDLSPENLTCDGELRGKALLRKATQLKYALKECA